MIGVLGGTLSCDCTRTNVCNYSNHCIPRPITNVRIDFLLTSSSPSQKVQVGNDQEKAQSERNSHSKNRGGEKLN